MRSDAEMAAVVIGPPEVHNSTIFLAPYDAEWPRRFEREAEQIRGALGDRVQLLEHAGSTSVPGLSAKPIIDIVLAVADSSDEQGYVPALEEAGYQLRIREPDWHQHRLVKPADKSANVHIFTVGCAEIERMLGFRDWLRTHDDDRQRYESAKQELAAQTWKYVQHYADAKSEVVEEIVSRSGVTAASCAVY